MGHLVYHNQLVFFYLSRQKIYIELKGWIRPYYQSSKFKLIVSINRDTKIANPTSCLLDLADFDKELRIKEMSNKFT